MQVYFKKVKGRNKVKAFMSLADYNISGKGLVMVVNCPSHDPRKPSKMLPVVDEVVLINSQKYVVKKVEMSRCLTDPPLYSTTVALVVKELY